MARPQVARPQLDERGQAPAFIGVPQRTRYLVERREDVWFITFAGKEYGPYRSEREAKLFAIEAAHKLGERGGETEVVLADEAGDLATLWIYGQNAYPPRG